MHNWCIPNTLMSYKSHKQVIQCLLCRLSQSVRTTIWSTCCSTLIPHVHQHANIHCLCAHSQWQATCVLGMQQKRYRLSDLCPSASVHCVADCLNVWLPQWNMSEKLIMQHHSETHYELWMNLTLIDEILLSEFSENNIVYRVGGSLGCLSLILWAL